MTVWRVAWQSNLRPEHIDHDTEAKALAYEASLRRKGLERVATYRVEMTSE